MMQVITSENDNTLPLDGKHYVRVGWFVVVIGIFGFLIWAAFAPLDKGVSSTGYVITSGNRKTIQVSSSGTIDKILIFEGEQVKAGQQLIQLDQTQIRAKITTLQDQFYTVIATETRLLAELNELTEIQFPQSLTQIETEKQTRVAEIIQLQKQLFTSRQDMLKSELKSYHLLAEGLDYQVKELNNALGNKKIQQDALKEQMDSMKSLSDKAYLSRHSYLDIKREHSEVMSEISEINGRIGQFYYQSLEVLQRREQRKADYQREVRSQLVQTQMEANEKHSQLSAVQLELSHLSVTSPVDGTVAGLNVSTQGGVVNYGQHLMDIIPSNSALEIDSRLSIHLVDKVHPGLTVDLMFTAFNQNKTPKLSGRITTVSADRLIDQNTGENYYLIRIALSSEEITRLKGSEIRPGMPVEVFIKTGSRSLLSYLFKPIIDRAFMSLTEE